ncbi:hypothetical protein PInf_000706 [Phytophthora infestans]|nr:hypothetical protein PInf_000706 [Phytophthora infestans]
MMWLRNLRNPKAVVYFVLSMESGEDARCIDLKDVLDISEEDMDIITKNNRFCTSLHLARCSQLSDATMRRIALCCSQLEELDISYCTLITDLGLAAVGRYCNRLVRLKIIHCSQIRDVGVEAIVRCRLLEELDVTHCPLFSPETLARFVKRKVNVTCRKLEQVLVTTALEAIESKEQHERQEAEKQQQNEISVDALNYMTPERRAKYVKTLLAAKPGVKAVVSEGQKSSNNLPPIVRSEHED